MVVKIDSYDCYGRGVSRIDHKVCFVKGALVGEVVEIKIVEEKKSFLVAVVTRVLEKSLDRIEPLCPYYEKCGGCHFGMMSYSASLRAKENTILSLFRKNGFSHFSYLGIVPGQNYHYRNKIVLHSDGSSLGLYQEGSHDLVPIDACLLADARINQVIPTLSKDKDVMIRVSNVDDAMLVGESKDVIISAIGSKKYRISAQSFFQVNSEMCEKLYHYIYEIVKMSSATTVLDLYCGIGTIGIYIHDLVREVLGIEIVKEAVRDAKYNQKLNHVSNISFLCGDVSKYASRLEKKYDFVIVDPPRAGLKEKVIEELIRIDAQTILYVSCNPATLIRDLKRFSDFYSLDSMKLFDMFPNTYHVECVCVLKKRF